MRYFLLIIVAIFLMGCQTTNKKLTPPPSVSTAEVVKSLEETKTELKQAGESNTVVAKKIDSALTLAERLEKLLEEIEKEQDLLKGDGK
jgi:PBP1b-binding outer membrane lipoprotein LpoB